MLERFRATWTALFAPVVRLLLRLGVSPDAVTVVGTVGVVAGAGIAAHLHQHVVPRWGGDANFLPIVGRTKALPELLGDTRARLAAAWPAPVGG